LKENPKGSTTKEKGKLTFKQTHYFKYEKIDSQPGMQQSILKRREIKISNIRNFITQVLH